MSQPKPTLNQQQTAIQSRLLELYVRKADLEDQLATTNSSLRELRTVLAGIQVAANAAPEGPPAGSAADKAAPEFPQPAPQATL